MNEEDTPSVLFETDCEEEDLLTMEPIGELRQNLRGFKSFFILTEVVGVCLLILMLFWTGSLRGGFEWTSNPNLQFNLHPLLMTIGMIFLYGQSILIYRMLRDGQKKKLKIIHGAINVAAFILVVIALKAVFDFHNLSVPPKPNMYSLHSWIGLTAVILFSLQYVVGFVAFFFPGLHSHLRSAYLPIHRFFGISIFVLAIATSLIGLNEKGIFTLADKYYALFPEAVLMNFIGILMVVFGILVVYLVTNTDYKRLPKPEDENLINRNIE